MEGTAVLPKGVYVFRARPWICRNVRDSECGGDGFVEFVLVGGYGRSGLDLGSGLRLGIESVVFPAVHREIPLDKGHVAEPFEIVSVGKVIRISDESHGRKHRDYRDDDDQFGQRERRDISKGSPHVRIIVSHRDFPSKTAFQRMYRFFFFGQPFHLFTNRGLLVSEFIDDTVFPTAEVIDRFANFLAIPIPRASNVFRPSLRKNRFETFRVRHRTSSPVIGEVRPASVQNEFFSVFRPVSAGSRNPLANFDADPGPGRGHYGGKNRRGHGQVVASDERPDSRFFFDGGSLKGLPSRPDGIRVGEFRYRIGRNFREAVPAGFRIENPLVGDRFFRSRRD